jgi:hypothetical protein
MDALVLLGILGMLIKINVQELGKTQKKLLKFVLWNMLQFVQQTELLIVINVQPEIMK